MCCAFETFEVQADLKEACRELDRHVVTSVWTQMMTQLSIKIQQNRTDPSKVKIQGEAKAVLQKKTECMVSQTETIQKLQEQLTVVVQFK